MENKDGSPIILDILRLTVVCCRILLLSSMIMQICLLKIENQNRDHIDTFRIILLIRSVICLQTNFIKLNFSKYSNILMVSVRMNTLMKLHVSKSSLKRTDFAATQQLVSLCHRILTISEIPTGYSQIFNWAENVTIF